MSIQHVWRKENLPPGDLQLLEASNPSGVLRLTQANNQIDQTTYFRNVVFSQLSWIKTQGKEMASASFNLVINGKVIGIFKLDISHKPSWESNQSNYTTGLHWGQALPYIKDGELIGKTLSLYKADKEPFDYQINIA